MISSKSHKEVLSLLADLYGIQVVTVINGTYCILSKRDTWYTLSDNGGEYTVALINSGVSIYVEYDCQPAVTTGTVAYRIYRATHGLPTAQGFVVDFGELVEVEEWDYNDVEDES